MQLYDLPLAFALGVAAHLGIFIRGEWHLKAPTVFLIHVGALVSLPMAWASLTNSKNLLQCYLTSSLFFVVYLGGLFSSIATYRLFFHRLRSFPGPKGAAVSKFWHAWKCRNSTNHLLLDDLYHKYGSFVRTGKHCKSLGNTNLRRNSTGPSEITIFHAEGQEALDGSVQHNTRSDWYEIVHPRVSPIFSRTEKDHRDRRDIWNYALSSKSQHCVSLQSQYQ